MCILNMLLTFCLLSITLKLEQLTITLFFLICEHKNLRSKSQGIIVCVTF